MKRLIKRLIFPKGRQLRRIRGGIAQGMLMELDLVNQLQRFFGLDERELLPAFRLLMPMCRSLIDIGANDGYYTIAFLRSSAERVVACEPGHIRDRLLFNASANGFQPDERFVVEDRLIGNGEEAWIRISTLVGNLPGPVLLKVDIDGGEFNLLQSAEECMRLPELRWIMETHSKELEDQCILWFLSNGYKTQIIKNAWWRSLLPEQRPLAHNRWLIAYQ
jgi:hypothetical protein